MIILTFFTWQRRLPYDRHSQSNLTITALSLWAADTIKHDLNVISKEGRG